MRDAGALLSNLPALLVIVRSPTQVGKFTSVFVQLLQKYLLNFYISICSTFTTVFVQVLQHYLFNFYNSICSTFASIFVQTFNQICYFPAGAAERVQAAIWSPSLYGTSVRPHPPRHTPRR